MENYKLVLPEHLNHFEVLFGGYLLKWVDEMAWIAASLDFPHCRFVTIGMDRVEFKKSIQKGTILKFQMTRESVGTTSVSYVVDVYKAHVEHPFEQANQDSIFSTTVTLVNVDSTGHKRPV